MKKVLLTGGAGFIAHHVIRHFLKHTDWEIVSLDRLDYSGNLNRIADMMNEFDFRSWSIRLHSSFGCIFPRR